MAILSGVVGYAIFYMLSKMPILSIVAGAYSIMLHYMIHPSWRKIGTLFISLIFHFPLAIIQSFIAPFHRFETFEIAECQDKNSLIKTLSITLTPLSVVFLKEDNRLHIHKVVRPS